MPKYKEKKDYRNKNMDLSLEKSFAIAESSKSVIRFGSFIEKNGLTLGYGCNRHPTVQDRLYLKGIDYCVHAEEAALIMALKKGANLSNAVLYVAGFLKNGSPVIKKKPSFTCERCAKRVLLAYNLPVRVPTYRGWQELSPSEAYDSSLKFKNFTNYWWGLAKCKNARK